jgi:hypothetical protein
LDHFQSRARALSDCRIRPPRRIVRCHLDRPIMLCTAWPVRIPAKGGQNKLDLGRQAKDGAVKLLPAGTDRGRTTNGRLRTKADCSDRCIFPSAWRSHGRASPLKARRHRGTRYIPLREPHDEPRPLSWSRTTPHLAVSTKLDMTACTFRRSRPRQLEALAKSAHASVGSPAPVTFH